MPTQDGLESTVSFYNGAVEPQPLGEGAIKDLITSQPAQAIGRSSRSPCLPARTVRTQSYVSPHSTYTGYTAYLCPLPAHVPPSPQPQGPWGRWPRTQRAGSERQHERSTRPRDEHQPIQVTPSLVVPLPSR
ncbi:hypothetical protein VFPBJ_06706 [Purpureocillium lilacinum]|uniref:Uncharacterized protein n=1 Tax=Purpureocillium lilacinum TaxID=33203 RepID=A0A179GL20_PURLI|nr:hypothetical protein VFPBJ_06706 [Purpureocillium lilacinum]